MTIQEQKYGFAEPFQQLIVAAALQDALFLPMYADLLKPQYFDYEYLTSIMRIAQELLRRNSVVPTRVVLYEEVKDFCTRFQLSHDIAVTMLDRLSSLYALDVTDMSYIRERVIKFGQRQAFKAAVLHAVQNLNASEDFGEKEYEKSRRMMDDAMTVGQNVRNLGLSVYKNLEEIPKLAARSSAGLLRKIPTGYETFDKMTNGGPGRGEMYAILGESGRGKSSWLINVAGFGVKNGFNVFHYTIGDLDEVDVGIRYAAHLTRTSTIDVIRGTESYIKKAGILRKYDRHLHIKEFPSGEATMAHIRAHAMRLCSVEGIRPDIIIIDYPEELAQTNDSMYLSGGEVYTQIRNLGKDMEAVMYVASQPKTEWQTGAPHEVLRGKHLAESSKKLHKLDGLLSWNMTPEEEGQGRGRLWVDKQRRNKSFAVIHCRVELEKMLITETKPPPEPPPSEKPHRRRRVD